MSSRYGDSIYYGTAQGKVRERKWQLNGYISINKHMDSKQDTLHKQKRIEASHDRQANGRLK